MNMGLFSKKKAKVEEPTTSSLQDVSNNEVKSRVKAVDPEPKVPTPVPTPAQTFNIVLTVDQLLKRIQQLEQSENLQLYIKASEGQEEYEELQELIGALPDEYKR